MRIMSVTIEERLYRLLKKAAGPRGMSRYIGRALEEKLLPTREALYQEYFEASQDADRQKAVSDWEATETEGWN